MTIEKFIKSVDLENKKFDPHSLKNPERVKISEIISKIQSGRWVLPHFQRYFDWKRKNIKEFLESIFSDYYVGSLLLWDTERNPEVAIMPIKGVNIPGDIKAEAIVLDGQQRLTSLYYAIEAPDFPLKGSSSRLFFYINFQNFLEKDSGKEVIEYYPKGFERIETYEKLLFPFTELPNFDEWVDGIEDYFLEKNVLDQAKIRKLRRVIDKRLKHIWGGFEIPYVVLPTSMELYQVTEIFERINTRGKLLSVFDLLIARMYKYEIKLKELWDATSNTRPEIKRSTKKIDKLPIYLLQALALCYSRSSSTKREDILKIHQNVYQNSGRNFQADWEEISKHIDEALKKIGNLRDGFGVVDPKEVPFGPMIPVLAALMKEIRNKPNKAQCLQRLNIWYWASVFSNAYSASADSRMSADFKDMKKWFSDSLKMPKSIGYARNNLGRIDFKETDSSSDAMYRGILSLTAIEGAKDFESGLGVENASILQKHHMFPKAEFGGRKYIDSILNITWMPNETNQKIIRYKKPSVYIKEFIKKYRSQQDFLKVLETHLISTPAYKYLLRDDFEHFLEERQRTIMQKIGNLLGVKDLIQQQTLISPAQPFTNETIFLTALESCSEYIHRVDKYFSRKGLELLAKSVNPSRIQEVKILCSTKSANESLRDDFKRFRSEMSSKGVIAELRVLRDTKLSSEIHDRWIISQNRCFNIPSPDTIARGQYSEINETRATPPFEKWWSQSKDIISDWNQISPALSLK